MKKIFRCLSAFLLSLCLVLSFAACGASSDYAVGEYTDSGYSDYDYKEEIGIESPVVNGTVSSGDKGSYSGEDDAKFGASEGDSTDSLITVTQDKNKKLVYTCEMTMETTGFSETIAALQKLIEKYDGFVESESQTDSANSWYYEDYKKTSGTLTEYVTVRIPTENFENFLSELSKNGKVRKKNMQVLNITTSYNNTEIAIAALKEQESRLLEMMGECSSIEEMITVEARLTEVQAELSMYQRSLSGMDMDVAYSTIDLTINEVLEYTKDDEPVYTSTFKDRLMNTLQDSWETLLEFLEDLLFFVIRATPILLVLGAINGGIAAIVVNIIKAVKRKKQKKAAQAAE